MLPSTQSKSKETSYSSIHQEERVEIALRSMRTWPLLYTKTPGSSKAQERSVEVEGDHDNSPDADLGFGSPKRGCFRDGQ